MAESFKLNKDMIYRKIGEQRMLVPIGKHIDEVRSIFTLNATAAFLLDSLQEGQTVDEVTEAFVEEFEIPTDIEPRKAVEDVITELRKFEILL